MNNIKIDLHVHTNHSDGRISPQEIFDLARQEDISILAITDHDNIDVFNRLDTYNTYDIKIIPGFECDVSFEKRVLHILMYNFDLKDKKLSSYFNMIRKNDIKVFKRMIKDNYKLNHISFDKKTIKEFIKNNQFFDKVRLNNLLTQENYAPTPKEAFLTLTKDIQDKKRLAIPAKKFFKIAKSCKAQTILAHPMRYSKDIEEVKEIISKLMEMGLDGIEVYNNRESLEDEQALLTFAQKNHLLITGGSDFHHTDRIKDGVILGKTLCKDIPYEKISKEILKKS